MTLNHTSSNTGHITQDIKQMFGAQRTPQDLVTFQWYKTFFTQEDDTKLHTGQDTGEDRACIDLAPQSKSSDEGETSVTVACPFLMKSKTMWTCSSWKCS